MSRDYLTDEPQGEVKLNQDDVTQICQRVVDHEMDTPLVANQFEINRRRVQQLANEYRGRGEIPHLDTLGRKPYSEYPDDLEDRGLALHQRRAAGAARLLMFCGLETTSRSPPPTST